MAQAASERPVWMRRFGIFWRVIVVISLGLGALGAALDDAALPRSWRGLAMALLIGAFLACYELFERSEPRRTADWPVPSRHVLLYLIAQVAILVGLLHFSHAFFGPLLSLQGQVFSALPMRRWPATIGPTAGLLAAPLGVYDDLLIGDWGTLASFLFAITILVGIAVFISVLFDEHHKRDDLIAELRQAKASLERYATQAEELAALRERARLARDMHDSLGHALVVVNVKLEAAQRLYAVERGRGDAELEATRALVRETMAELRRSLADLRAPMPVHHDLSAALGRLAADTRARSGLDVRLAVPSELLPLPPATAEALWRVAREALNNVERHAAATHTAVELEHNNGALVLRVSDDGRGAAPADLARDGHYGIVGMREHMAALGGSLDVATWPGSGTRVEAAVPLDKDVL